MGSHLVISGQLFDAEWGSIQLFNYLKYLKINSSFKANEVDS